MGKADHMTDLEQQKRDQRREKIKKMKRRRILAYCILAVLIFLTVFLIVKLIGLFSGNTEKDPAADPGTDPPVTGAPAVYPAWPLEFTTVLPPLPPYDYAKPTPESAAVESSYFSNAIFIGDSRVEGLAFYNSVPGADYAYSGSISVDNAFSLTYRHGDESYTLEQKLGAKQYGAVYLMFGLNELGWPYPDVFYSGYRALIDQIKALQPNAVIYIQSVFPVTAAASASSSYLDNAAIKDLNTKLLALAAEKQVCFLDLSAAFADESGALPAASAESNGVALANDFYPNWFEYLKTHTVSKEIVS